jgi:hypothetical protein
MECFTTHSTIVVLPKVRMNELFDPVTDYLKTFTILITFPSKTSKGVFHIADFGLPVPADKIKVPLITYAKLLEAALQPPDDLNLLPYTSHWNKPVQSMVALMLRPLVCPEVPGVSPEKRLEVRFFVPGGCVSNLDFVESIFGNAGDPSLPENDSALDTNHWTGTSGCVILAPRKCTCDVLSLIYFLNNTISLHFVSSSF